MANNNAINLDIETNNSGSEYHFPSVSGSVVIDVATQTLSNKTFSDDVIFEANGDFNGSINLDKNVVFTEYNAGSFSGGAVTVNWNNSQKQRLTINGNGSVLFINPNGAGNYLLRVIQNTPGSQINYWDTDVRWSNGSEPTITSSSGSIDILSFYYDGLGSYYGQAAYNFV